MSMLIKTSVSTEQNKWTMPGSYLVRAQCPSTGQRGQQVTHDRLRARGSRPWSWIRPSLRLPATTFTVTRSLCDEAKRHDASASKPGRLKRRHWLKDDIGTQRARRCKKRRKTWSTPQFPPVSDKVFTPFSRRKQRSRRSSLATCPDACENGQVSDHRASQQASPMRGHSFQSERRTACGYRAAKATSAARRP